MADEQSTESTEVETAEVEDNDTELEDMEVSSEELEQLDESDSADDSEDDEESDTESEPKEEDDQEESNDEAEEVEEPEEQLSDEDKQKALNREYAERRLREKAEREATIKQQQQEYVAEADPDDPRDMAVRQLQIDAYNNKVESNTNKLTNSYERAIKDFDVLNSQAPEIQAELNAALDAFQAMNVTIDAYGNPIEVRGDLYEFLQTKADSIKNLTSIGARGQDKSKTKEKSKVLTTPNRAPKEPKKDADIEAFDEEASKW